MIIRVVKMVFQEGSFLDFKAMMEINSKRIKAFDGCEYLQLLQDQDDPHIVFTYSHWRDEEALENYRHSDLFREIWPIAKAKFAKRAEAWTLDRFIERS